mgnify:CR=1 FL=1
MGKKLLRSIVNNFGLKVLAFGFAFLLWLLVYNTNDPYITKNFTTTVTITWDSNDNDAKYSGEIDIVRIFITTEQAD